MAILKFRNNNTPKNRHERRAAVSPAGRATYSVGHEKIHPEQVTTALNVMRDLRLRRRMPLVVAQFQSGKTDVIIAIIDMFIKKCQREGKRFQVIVTCGVSDLELIAQTYKRLNYWSEGSNGDTLRGANLGLAALTTTLVRNPVKFEIGNHGVITINQTKLGSCDWNEKAVQERLVVIDEAHLSLVKGGRIDKFLETLGVHQSEQVHCWDTSHGVTHVVPVSATPFPQSLLSNFFGDRISGQALINVHYMAPGPGYVGVKEMHARGRFLPVEDLFQSDGSPSTFLHGVLSRFKKDCKKDGPGFLIIRATGEKHATLYAWLNTQGYDIRAFDSTKNLDSKAISELNRHLNTAPAKPQIVLIRAAMRAGITLMENHIRGWVEIPSVQCDTQTQAGIGRACGYYRKETYPIYTQIKAVKEIILYYDECGAGKYTCMPGGTKSSAMRPVYAMDLSTAEVVTIEEACALRDSLNAGDSVNGIKKKRGKGVQLTTTSRNASADIASDLLKGKILRRTAHSDVDTLGVIINGPHPKYPESYAALIAQYPHVEGKVILTEGVTLVRKAPDPLNALSYHKKDSAFQPN